MTTDRPYDRTLSRRDFIKGGASAAAMLGLAAYGSSASPALGAGFGHGTFTAADWGGSSDTGIRTAWGKPFSRATGWNFQSVSPVDYGKFVAQVDSHNYQWDWIDSEGWFPYAHPKVLENLDYSVIGVGPSDMAYPEFWRGANHVASYSTSYVVSYLSTHKGPVPQNWQEFFDVKRIPGVRCLYNYCYGSLDIALLGDGVPYSHLYPLDVERGLKKIKSISDHLIYWNTGAEAQQALISRSADFVVTWNNRVGYLALSGLPVEIMWNEHIHTNGMHIIPKGDPHAPLCNQFIKTAMKPANQAALALAAGFAPTTKKGNAALDPSIRPWVNTTPKNWDKGVGVVNDEWWGTNYDAVNAKWAAALA